MSLHRIALLVLLMVSIAHSHTGCVVQRTVKNGNEVVSQGYVVKAPLIGQ